MDAVERFRVLARTCGIWPIARMMRKQGYTLAQTRWTLLSREDYPVLRRAVNRRRLG